MDAHSLILAGQHRRLGLQGRLGSWGFGRAGSEHVPSLTVALTAAQQQHANASRRACTPANLQPACAHLGVVGRARQHAAHLRVEAACLHGGEVKWIMFGCGAVWSLLMNSSRYSAAILADCATCPVHSHPQLVNPMPAHQHRAHEVGALRIGAGALQRLHKATGRQLCSGSACQGAGWMG